MKDGWRQVRLGEIAKVGAGNPAPQGTAPYSGGLHPFVRTLDVGLVRFGEVNCSRDRLNDAAVLGMRRFPSGTILLPKSGASTLLDYRVILGTEAYVSSHLAAVNADPSQVTARFLLYALSRVHARDLVHSGSYPTLSLADITGIRMGIPPLSEQQRIVAILDTASESMQRAVLNANASLAETRALYESQLETLVGDVGRDWERVRLSEMLQRGWILSHLDGNHGSDYPRAHEFGAKGVPYVSASCLNRDTVDLSRAKYLAPPKADRLRKGIARDGDVLFAHNATVGPVAILRTRDERVILGTSLTYYRCDNEHVLAPYLAHYMRSSLFKEQYLPIMRQQTRNQVPITRQREFYHVVPPRCEQQRLVNLLDAVKLESDRLASLYDRKLAALGELRSSLLHEAFSGNL